MNIMDALSSLPLVLSLKSDTYMQSEHSPSWSLDEDVSASISTITLVTGNTSLDVSPSHSHSSTPRRCRPSLRSSLIVKNGLASMRKPHVHPATSRTNRFSKLTKDSHQKEKHDLLHQQLKEQVRQLESKQNNLITEVEYLHLYKHHLEVQCQETTLDYKPRL